MTKILTPQEVDEIAVQLTPERVEGMKRHLEKFMKHPELRTVAEGLSLLIDFSSNIIFTLRQRESELAPWIDRANRLFIELAEAKKECEGLKLNVLKVDDYTLTALAKGDTVGEIISSLRSEVERLTKEFADVRNEAEDADIQLACIADQLGIKGSIKDWLQSIGGAIRELKAEVERLSTPRIIGGQEMENILELKAEVERFIDERKGYYAVCQKYREQIEGLEKERDELAKAVGECNWKPMYADEDDGNYGTSCGQFFSIIEGSPELNGFKFCTYCGKKLIVQPVAQVNLDTKRTIDESGGQKGDEG